MYLIVGANGYLGSYLLKTVLEQTNDKIIATSRDLSQAFLKHERVEWLSVDIEDLSQVEKLSETVDSQKEAVKVLFLAALHHPDKVAKDPKKAWGINITSLSLFLGKANNIKCFFYPSTDSVYGESVDGKAFGENDSLCPVNVYGTQKVLAEKLVLFSGYNVLRYPFLIGKSLVPHKKHFYDIMKQEILEGNEFSLFSDSFRSAISFDMAAKLTIDIIENYYDKAPKALNVCADKQLSKYEIGVMLAQKLSVSSENLKGISVNDNGDIFETKRANSTIMDNSLLKKTLGIKEIKLIL